MKSSNSTAQTTKNTSIEKWEDDLMLARLTMEVISQYTNISFSSVLMSNYKVYNLKTEHNNQLLLQNISKGKQK